MYTRIVVGRFFFVKGQKVNIHIFCWTYLLVHSSALIKLVLESKQQGGFFPPTNHSGLLVQSVMGFRNIATCRRQVLMNLATKPGVIKMPAIKTALLFIENVPSVKLTLVLFLCYF